MSLLLHSGGDADLVAPRRGSAPGRFKIRRRANPSRKREALSAVLGDWADARRFFAALAALARLRASLVRKMRAFGPPFTGACPGDPQRGTGGEPDELEVALGTLVTPGEERVGAPAGGAAILARHLPEAAVALGLLALRAVNETTVSINTLVAKSEAALKRGAARPQLEAGVRQLLQHARGEIRRLLTPVRPAAEAVERLGRACAPVQALPEGPVSALLLGLRRLNCSQVLKERLVELLFRGSAVDDEAGAQWRARRERATRRIQDWWRGQARRRNKEEYFLLKIRRCLSVKASPAKSLPAAPGKPARPKNYRLSSDAFMLKHHVLFTACKSSNMQRLEKARFVFSPADINISDAEGNCPLFYAAGKGWVELSRFLLDRGAEPNFPCRAGRTPLHAAFQSQNEDLIRACIESGGDLNKVNGDGLTPLAFGTPRLLTKLGLMNGFAVENKADYFPPTIILRNPRRNNMALFTNPV